MKYRDPNANTFRDITLCEDGSGMPERHVPWMCTCGHASEEEHNAAPLMPVIVQWWHRIFGSRRETL